VGTFVELIRDHSVRYVLLAAAILVIALGVLGTAVATVILIAVGLSRLFENLVFSGHMWATDTLVGGIFVLLGALSIALGNRTRAS
jgi:predicted membrane channel-forming protein YqfA (hemolysin III family)